MTSFFQNLFFFFNYLNHWSILFFFFFLIQKQPPSNSGCWFNLTGEVSPVFRDDLDRPVSCLLYRTLHFCFVLGFPIKDVQNNQETSAYKFSASKPQKSLIFCWQRVQRKFFSLGEKKKQLMTLGYITAARPSWSLNNLGLLRGFILWSGVLIYFRLVVVLHCYMKRQSLRCNQQLAICGGGGGGGQITWIILLLLTFTAINFDILRNVSKLP